MHGRPRAVDAAVMPTFLLAHRHSPAECATAFAAWRGFESPLRRRSTIGTCMAGGHALWWAVAAADATKALGHLPPFVAERTGVTEVREVPIP